LDSSSRFITSWTSWLAHSVANHVRLGALPSRCYLPWCSSRLWSRWAAPWLMKSFRLVLAARKNRTSFNHTYLAPY